MHSQVTVNRLLDFFGYGFTVENDQTAYADLTLHEGVFEVMDLTPNGYKAGDNGIFTAIPMEGDSGGPAFVLDGANSNGFGRLLAGVDSYYMQDTSEPTPYAFETGVSVVAQWIESSISADHITDYGYGNWIQATVDVNGDHVLDYCRIDGAIGSQFLACQIGMFNESNNGTPTRWQLDPYEFRTPPGVVV
jgi:hypothetical protein